MEDGEAQRLLELLDKAIHDTRRSRREIERRLGLGQGYLGSLFRGRIELKVWHVYRLARELKVDPLTFFFAVSPPEDPKWVLRKLGLDPDKVLALKDEAPMAAAAAKDAAPPVGVAKDSDALTSEQVEKIVLRTIRSELKRLGLGEPGE